MNMRSVMVVSIVEEDEAFVLSMAKEEDAERRREDAGSKTRDRLGIFGEWLHLWVLSWFGFEVAKQEDWLLGWWWRLPRETWSAMEEVAFVLDEDSITLLGECFNVCPSDTSIENMVLMSFPSRSPAAADSGGTTLRLHLALRLRLRKAEVEIRDEEGTGRRWELGSWSRRWRARPRDVAVAAMVTVGGAVACGRRWPERIRVCSKFYSGKKILLSERQFARRLPARRFSWSFYWSS